MTGYPAKCQMTRNQRKRKMRVQRLMGVAMLALAVFFIWMTATANEDSTRRLLVGLIARPIMFSKNHWVV